LKGGIKEGMNLAVKHITLKDEVNFEGIVINIFIFNA
jgi:hypothetical protein